MKTILSVTIIAIHALAFIPLQARAEGGQLDKGKYEIACEGAKVTVRANDANTVEILQEFAKKSGITFNKYVGKTKSVTLDLNNVKTEDFLNRVLGSYVATSKRKNGVAQISKVTIMDEEEDTSPPPPPRVKEKSRQKPPRPKREERPSRRRRRRSRMSPRKRGPAKPRAPEPPDQPPEGAADEPQPPDPSDQPPEDPPQVPQTQESEEQPPEF